MVPLPMYVNGSRPLPLSGPQLPLCYSSWQSITDTLFLMSRPQSMEGGRFILCSPVGWWGEVKVQGKKQRWPLGPHGLSSCEMTGHTCQDGCHLATLLLPCPGSPRWTLTLEGQVPVTCPWRWPLLLDKQARL